MDEDRSHPSAMTPVCLLASFGLVLLNEGLIKTEGCYECTSVHPKDNLLESSVIVGKASGTSFLISNRDAV